MSRISLNKDWTLKASELTNYLIIDLNFFSTWYSM